MEEATRPPVTAYGEGNGLLGRHMIKLVALGTLLLFLILNGASRDYSNDAEIFLRSVGRESAIETVVPKSAAERAEDERSLAKIVTSLQEKTLELEARIEKLEAGGGEITTANAPKTA